MVATGSTGQAQPPMTGAMGNHDARFALALLLAANTLNFFDRQIFSAVVEPVRREWSLSDTEIGLLATSFTLLYAIVGIPLGRLADLWNRKLLLSAGLALWSALTAASGFASGFWSLFAARMGVGVGEAACAPVCNSLIGDFFAADRRGRALSVFMLGLPLGLALSYAVSGSVAKHFGWRSAFFLAGIPGLAISVLVLGMRTPLRGAADPGTAGSVPRAGSPFTVLARIPTFRWIVISGAIHNFNLYALSSFLPAYIGRYHGADVQTAGFVTAIVIGLVGGAGMLASGWIGDRISIRRPDGRLLLAAVAILASVVPAYLALQQPPGRLGSFVLFQGMAYLCMYSYYSLVYAAIQDVVEPALRGTAMAVYFFAMYLLGASLGPVGTGWLSDFFARRAAADAEAGALTVEAIRAAGLHGAMQIVPALALLLALVLYAGSRALPGDSARLREWVRKGVEPAAG